VTSAAAAASTRTPRRHDWREIVATVLLSLAAVATAWSSYQATRWNGETTKASGRVNAVRIQAAREAGLAQNQMQVDIATFIQWVEARANGNAALETFYAERFRDEFRPAFDAWLDTDPLVDPDAPPTPFAMDEYVLAADTEADRLDAEADALAAGVRRNIERAGDLVLSVVLFAVALFFAGMSARLSSVGPRTVLLGVASVVFVGTLAWIATFPVKL
jgi:hypothetical protein